MSTQTGSISFESTKGIHSYAKQNFSTLSQVLGQFAVCETGASVANKKATIIPEDANWTLQDGTIVTVTFSNTNTQTTPTLNVNETGAKEIRDIDGNALTKAAREWPEGAAIALIYDQNLNNGNGAWRLQDSNLMERVHNAETEIDQTATSITSLASMNDTYTDPNGNTVTNNMKSYVNQTAQGITQSVSSTYATKTEIGNSELPYTEVEWVESDGTQFVYLDWRPEIATWGFEADFIIKNAFTSTVGAWRSDTNKNGYGNIFGVRNSSSTNDMQLGSFVANGGGLRIGGGNVGTAPIMKTDGTRQKISLIGTTLVKGNGTTQTLTRATETANKYYANMTVFAMHEGLRRSGTGNLVQPGSIRIYSLKFYNGTEVAVDLVGAKRKSDGMTGLYDKVANHFYPARGLLCGGEVGDLGIVDTVLDAIAKRNVMLTVDNRTVARMWEAEAPTLDRLDDGQQITVTFTTNVGNSTPDAIVAAGYDDYVGWDEKHDGSVGYVYLKLTLSDGSKTEWIPCFYAQGTRLTSHYGSGTPVLMTYREDVHYGETAASAGTLVMRGWWADPNYVDGNTVYSKYSDTVIAGKNGLRSYTLCMKDDEGNWTSIVNQTSAGLSDKTCYTGGLQLGGILWHATNATYAAGANGGAVWETYGGIDFRYSANGITNAAATTTLQLRKPIYLVGTLDEDDGLYYLDTVKWWTQDTFQEGRVYVQIGSAYNSYYAIFLAANNPSYVWDPTAQKLVEFAYSRIKKAETAIVQTNDLIGFTATGNYSSLKEYADGMIEQEASDRNSAISDMADEISLTVSQTYTSKASLDTRVHDEDTFLRRQLPSTVHTGAARIASVKGNTVKWNQLVNYTISTQTKNGVTFTKNGDGTLTANGTATADAYPSMAVSTVANHKYLLKSCPSGGSNATYLSYVTGAGIPFSDATRDTGNGAIYTPSTSAGGTFLPAMVRSGVTVSNLVFTPQIFDLTLMFGAGNEPATVAEFEALFPEPYYPYDPGSLLSVNLEGMKSVGFNQWDEEWETGAISSVTGQPSTGEVVRSKNFCRCLPNTTYYVKTPSANQYIFWYESNFTFIGAQQKSNGVVTSPQNASYFKIQTRTDYYAPYNHNICINLSDPARNGTYEPYAESTREFDLSGHFPTGLKSAGTVYDELDFENRKAVTRIGAVDLGSVGWAAVSDSRLDVGQYFYTGIGSMQNATLNVVLAKYSMAAYKGLSIIVGYYGSDIDKITFVDTSNPRIYIIDSSYTDAAAFKAAMSGVMLYYELATPTETDISDALQSTYSVEAGGTEFVLVDEELAAPQSAPVPFVFEYGLSAMDALADAVVRMSSAESAIVQNADNISMKVSQTDYNGQTVASLINQSPDEIKIQANHVQINGATTFVSGSTVSTIGGYLSDNYDSKGAAQTAVDNLEFGGRNLLRVEPSTYNQTAYLVYQIDTTESLSDIGTNPLVLQLWGVELDSGSTGLGLFWGGASVMPTSRFLPDANGYACVKFTPTQAHVEHAAAVNKFIRIYNYANGHSGSSLTIEKWKLERGNKPTDWSQAQEDLQAGIDAAASYELVVPLNSANGSVTAILYKNGSVCTDSVYFEGQYTSNGTTWNSWNDMTGTVTTGSKTASHSINNPGGVQTVKVIAYDSNSKQKVLAAFVGTLVKDSSGTISELTPKTSAVARTQRIYYRTDTPLSSSNNITGPTTWITEKNNQFNTVAPTTATTGWSTKITPLAMNTEANSTKYLYLYTCTQTQTVSQTTNNGTQCSASTVLLDENTTVIDGGNIITGSVTANALNANNINASNMLTIGAFNSNTQNSILNSEVMDELVSRGEQLIINGNAFMGDNTNFSNWVFDGSVTNNSKGSFTRTQAYTGGIVVDNFIPIDPTKDYTIEFDIKCGTDSNFPVGAKIYAFLNYYDVDNLQIGYYHGVYHRTNTTTTLTQDLKNGDTIVHFADLTNWWTETTASHQRSFIFWDYTNSFGYTYPENTYSRHEAHEIYANNDAVNKTNNTITLSSAWNKGTIPAGTKVSQNASGGNYDYIWWWTTQSTFPTEWYHAIATRGPSQMWKGVATVKLGFLWNYGYTSSAQQQQIWVTNISMMQKRITNTDIIDYTNSIRTWYAECSTAAATANKVATINPATTDFTTSILTPGTVVFVKFTVTNSAAVGDLTLNINNTGAKPIKQVRNGTVQNLPGVGYLAANATYQFTYDGTNWLYTGNYDSNSNDNARYVQFYNTIVAGEALAKESIIGGRTDGKFYQIKENSLFDLSHPLLWLTTALAANATNYANIYTQCYDRNLATFYTSFTNTTSNRIVYLVGTINGNTFSTYGSSSAQYLTITPPTTEDGRFYIPIGRLGNQSNGKNYFNYQVGVPITLYAYIDGKFRQVTPTEIVATHRIYYRTDTANNSLAAPTTWVAEATSNVYNAWTTKVPPLASGTDSSVSGYTKYLYLYTCEQRKRLDGTVECTKVLLDENTTIIDGGSIITNSIAANTIRADSGTFNTANIPNLSAAKITSGDIAAARIQANAVSAINATVNKIDAKNINVSQINIGDLAGEIGGRNLLLGTSEPFILTAGYMPLYTISDIVPALNSTDQLTISFWAKASASRYIDLYWCNTTANTGGTSYYNTNNFYPVFQLTTNWTKYIYTGVAGTSIANAAALRLRQSSSSHGSSSTGATIEVKEVMLEQATTPSAWQPAPEDIDGAINNLESDMVDAKKHTQVIISAENVNYTASGSTTAASLTATLYIDGVATTSNVTYQWNKDGTAISGATSQTLTVTGTMGLAHRYSCKCGF